MLHALYGYGFVGVAVYALMAAGGDLGASIAPQALGIAVDKVSLTEWAGAFGASGILGEGSRGIKVPPPRHIPHGNTLSAISR